MDKISLIIFSMLLTVILTTLLATLLTLVSPAKYVGENRTSIQYFQFMFLFLAISYVVLVFSANIPELVHQVVNTYISCIAAGCLVSGFYTRFHIGFEFYRNVYFWGATTLFALFNGYKHIIVPTLDAYLPGATGLSHILMLLVYVICIINCIGLLVTQRHSSKVSGLTISGMVIILFIAMYLMFVPLLFQSPEIQIAQTALGIILFLFVFGGVIATMFMEDLVNLHRKQAITDVMTGLKNRRYFLEQSEKQFSLAKRKNSPLSVIICDIDLFKNVNDTYGHDVGDRVIIAFSQLMQQELRTEDIIARFGGEEFVALLPGIKGNEAISVAERLRGLAENATVIEKEKNVQFTVSFGVAECHSIGVEKGLVNADAALYQAKESGRNQVRSFSFTM